ncbi:MAPEG family protein [Lacimicrobium sp. SS2-24]|uniref:MAPEG family protein n=1 Tax=Lacimicrobium sp. SS2-24 TaxID=2005569 RepID=UPI000B4BC0A2|nr:MAPEG family protein [Lacimicrobium sp. SS2-24]
MNTYFWFALLAATQSLLLLALALNVSRIRMRHKISLGDGNNKALMAAIRTHSNSIEQAPCFVLVVLALTLIDATSPMLPVLVIGFTLARLAHAWGMLYRVFMARRIGAGLTYVFQLLAIIAVLHALLA